MGSLPPLNAKFTADVSDLKAGVEQAKSSLGEVSEAAGGAKSGLAGLVESVTSTKASMLEMATAVFGGEAALETLKKGAEAAFEAFKEFAEQGEKLERLNMVTGLSERTLAQWDATAKITGVSAEALGMAMERSSARIEEGNKKALEGLERFGITQQEYLAMNPEERLQAIARGMEEIGGRSQQAAAVMEVFGRAGLSMLPALTEEAQKYRDSMSGAADKMAAAAEKGAEISKQWNAMNMELKALTVGLIDNIEKLGEWITLTGRAQAYLSGDEGEMPKVAGGQGLAFKGSQKGYASGSAGAAVSDIELMRIAAEQQKKADEDHRKALEEAKKLAEAQKHEAMDMSKGLDAAGAIMRKNAEIEETQALKEQFADNAHYLAIVKEADAALKLQEEFKEGSDTIIEAAIPAMSMMLGITEDAAKAMLGFPPPIETAKQKAHDFKEEMEKAAKAVSGIGDILGQLGGILGGKAGGLLSGLGGVAGEGAGALADLGSGNIMGAISKGLGAVTGLIGTVKNLFAHPEFEKIMEDTGKRWGVHISEGLAKQIEQTESQFHVGKDMAELLNMDKIMGEAGGDPAQFKDKINNLMEAVKLGSVPAKEGIDQLGKAFSDLKTAAAGGSIASEAAMVQMIKRARELGETIPGMDEAIKAAVDRSVAGMKDFIDGIGASGKEGTLLSPEAGQAVAGVFDAVSVAAEAQYGIVDAVDKLGSSFDAMQKKLPEGTTLGAGAAEFAHMKALLETPEFKGAAKGAKGLADVTGGLIESGNLTPQAMEAIGHSTVALYNQAKGVTGATDIDALKAIAPELKELQKAQALGAKLGPEEAKLLSDAQKAGILPLEDIQTQQLKVQQSIDRGVASLHGETPGAPPSSYHAAEGFFSSSMPIGPLRGGGTGLVVHPGEQVRVMPAGLKGGLGNNMTSNISVNLGTLVGDPSVLGDMLKRLVDDGHAGTMQAIQQASWRG